MTEFVQVVGWSVGKITISPGKDNDEEDVGTISVVLTAPKNELKAQDMDTTDIIGALNMHGSTKEPVSIQVRA